MADDKKRSPSIPAMFSHGGSFPPPPGRPRRSTEVLEELVETVAAKVAEQGRTLDRIEETVATKQDVDRLARVLKLHMVEGSKERAAAALRDQAVMGMLGDILSRLPEASGARAVEEPEALARSSGSTRGAGAGTEAHEEQSPPSSTQSSEPSTS